ncbi:hypothetical protein [Bradyrhizobium sp. 170]|uniref:hypothetical protein n=1 Tax=Bradyrhizobium sp. 170 TaxID=2782641 RepID=UPI001FFE8DF8|nr:hypothetical protein [Bradyrhizobium sp. 170]UPK03618.1 hypothetical protein IVB05_40030 [Bradyrhizobium sp. 170]
MNADLAFAVGISLDIVTKRASATPITAYPACKAMGVRACSGEARRISGKIGTTSLHPMPPPIQTSR